jgi:hypothetical protein
VTAAIDHDQKTHSVIKTKEIDPNDVVPEEKPKHETPKKVQEVLKIMKDPKVEAKKAASEANKTSNANKTTTPTVTKLKADS